MRNDFFLCVTETNIHNDVFFLVSIENIADDAKHARENVDGNLFLYIYIKGNIRRVYMYSVAPQYWLPR